MRSEKKLKGNIDLSLLETLNDVKDQLYALVYPGFLDELNLEELRQYPRYLKAILNAWKNWQEMHIRIVAYVYRFNHFGMSIKNL